MEEDREEDRSEVARELDELLELDERVELAVEAELRLAAGSERVDERVRDVRVEELGSGSVERLTPADDRLDVGCSRRVELLLVSLLRVSDRRVDACSDRSRPEPRLVRVPAAWVESPPSLLATAGAAVAGSGSASAISTPTPSPLGAGAPAVVVAAPSAATSLGPPSSAGVTHSMAMSPRISRAAATPAPRTSMFVRRTAA